ncbi:hypothetical protein VB779_13385 [Haloarculaceae archaeon H-GB11]|nr:hypothetical protein [Haloarculaceae archaeon H-GB11]
MPISPTRSAELRDFAETLLSFRTTAGREHVAREWLVDRPAALGFETYEWSADAETLATHPSFPDDPAAIDVEGRPSVAGVVEFGDPDAGRTLVLNGHFDVVPAEEASWSSPRSSRRGTATTWSHAVPPT